MSIIRDFVAEVGGIAALAPLGGRIHPLVDHGQALPSLVYNNRGTGSGELCSGKLWT